MADPPTLTLRAATPADIDFALHVWQTAMQQYVTESRGWDEEFEVNRQREGLTETPYHVIEVDGARAGTLITSDQGEYIYVIGLYFLLEVQRHGYGSRVLNELIAAAHQRSASVRLRCLRTNPGARRLYERMGFVVIDDTEDNYVLMELAPSLSLREATPSDIEFLIAVDLLDEGVTQSNPANLARQESPQHRDKIAAFVFDEDKAAWVYEDTHSGRLIGAILWRYRNRLHEEFGASEIFDELEPSLFPPDGAFCEIFQLWIAPEYRRQGLATRLKRRAEAEALRHDVTLMYTHTEERNGHVIEMNLKLGYVEARRGPIWDDVVRVSLLKELGLNAA